MSFPEDEAHRAPPQPPSYQPPPSAPPYPGYSPHPYSGHQRPRRGLSGGAIAGIAAGAAILIVCVLGVVVAALNPEDTSPSGSATRAAESTDAPEPTRASASPASVAPSMVQMPNVVGKNAAVAGDELERAGFTEIQYGSVDPGETVFLPSNWRVVEQSHPAGQIISADTLIVLGCTKQR